MGEELLPCPFCGRKAEAFQDVAGSREPLVPGHGLTITSMSETYGVRCPSCEIEMVNPWVKLNDAIAAWNTRASTPPVGETSALAEELEQCKVGRQHFEHFDSRKLSVDYLVPEDLFNRILAALRKPAEPVGDEVERAGFGGYQELAAELERTGDTLCEHAAVAIRNLLAALPDREAIRREAFAEAAGVAEDEEELEGEPPSELAWCANELRAAVRVTKRNIATAIRNLADPDIIHRDLEGPGDA